MCTEDASRRTRKHRSPAEKVAILRRHLIDRVPISDLDFKTDLATRTLPKFVMLANEPGGETGRISEFSSAID